MFELSVVALVERYLSQNDCSPDYARRLIDRAEKLTKFAGGQLLLKDLTCELVNRWLASLAKAGLKPRTINCYRQAIYTVWQDAFMDGLCAEPPLRVRRSKVPAMIISAYTSDEIGKLIEAASQMSGEYRNGVAKREFWYAAVMLAYDSGLRRGDLMHLLLDDIQPNGNFRIVQRKTGQEHRGKLRPATLKAIEKLPRTDGRVLPFPHRKEVFSEHFTQLRKLAGVKRGTLKWVRRSTGSHAEKRRAGDGAKILGHRDPRVFERFYQDRSITHDDPIEPPPL